MKSKRKADMKMKTASRDRGGKCVCVFAGGEPGSLPASQAELEGPCWGWRVQASPLPPSAYWSKLGKKGGVERGRGKRGRERKTPRENRKRRRDAGKRWKETDSHGRKRRRRRRMMLMQKERWRR